MERRLFLKITLTVVGLLILLLYNIPFPVSKTVEALEINMADVTYSVPRQITIEGKYHLNLLTDDTFSGMVTVSGYDYANGTYPLRDIKLYGPKEPTHIEYNIPDSGSGMPGRTIVYMFGEFYYSAFFRTCMIPVFTHPDNDPYRSSYSTKDATVIVIGAESSYDAKEIAEGFFY